MNFRGSSRVITINHKQKTKNFLSNQILTNGLFNHTVILIYLELHTIIFVIITFGLYEEPI